MRLDVGDIADAELFVAEDESSNIGDILAILSSRSRHRSCPLLFASDSQGYWSTSDQYLWLSDANKSGHGRCLDRESPIVLDSSSATHNSASAISPTLEDFAGISNEHTTMLKKFGRDLAIQVAESSVAFINVTSKCRSGIKYMPEQLKITGSIATSAICRGINVCSKLTKRTSQFFGLFLASRSSLRVLLVPEGWESGNMQRGDVRILVYEFDKEISCLSAIATQSDEKLHSAQIKGSNNLIVVGSWDSHDIEIACISEHGDQIMKISTISSFSIGDFPIKQLAIMTPQRCADDGASASKLVYPLASFSSSGNVTLMKLSFRRSDTDESNYDVANFGTEVIADLSFQNGMKLVQISEATGKSNSFLIIRDESLEFVGLNYKDTGESNAIFYPTVTRLVISNVRLGYEDRLCLNVTCGSIEAESSALVAIAATCIYRSSLNGHETWSLARGKLSGSPTHISIASFWIPGRVLKCHRLVEGTKYGIIRSNPSREGCLLLYEWTDGTHVFATVVNKDLNMYATMGGPAVYSATDSLGPVLRTFALPLIGDNFEALHSGTPIGICFAKRAAQSETFVITIATCLVQPNFKRHDSLSNQILHSGFWSFEIKVPKPVELLRWSDICVASHFSTSLSAVQEDSEQSSSTIIVVASYGCLVLIERRRLILHPSDAAQRNKGLHVVAKSDLVSEVICYRSCLLFR
jgi:hypothetical protein